MSDTRGGNVRLANVTFEPLTADGGYVRDGYLIRFKRIRFKVLKKKKHIFEIRVVLIKFEFKPSKRYRWPIPKGQSFGHKRIILT